MCIYTSVMYLPLSFSLPTLQYLGGQTPPVVKNKIKALLYSWKVGLPTEGKIADAYEMLKKEGRFCVSGMCVHSNCFIIILLIIIGLVFDESQPPDATLKPEKQKPKVTLAHDPKQAKVYIHLYIIHYSCHTSEPL